MDETTGKDADQHKSQRRPPKISADVVAQQHFHQAVSASTTKLMSGIRMDNNDFSQSDGDSAFDVGVVTERTLFALSPKSNSNSSECRRSARKKIIKFDVRDLLNKNRKSHKIQIEARIDSNTLLPSTTNVESTILTSITTTTTTTSNKLSNTTATVTNTASTSETSPGGRRHSISERAFSFASSNEMEFEHPTSEIQGIIHDLHHTDVRRQTLLLPQNPKSVPSLIVSKMKNISSESAAPNNPDSRTPTAIASISRSAALFGFSSSTPPKKRGRPRKIKNRDAESEIEMYSRTAQDTDKVKNIPPENLSVVDDEESDPGGDSKTCKNLIVALKRVLLPNAIVSKTNSSSSQSPTTEPIAEGIKNFSKIDEANATSTTQPLIVFNQHKTEFDSPVNKDVHDMNTPANTTLTANPEINIDNDSLNCKEILLDDASMSSVTLADDAAKHLKQVWTYSSVLTKLAVKGNSVRSASLPPNAIEYENRKKLKISDSINFKRKLSKSLEILSTQQLNKKNPVSFDEDFSESSMLMATEFAREKPNSVSQTRTSSRENREITTDQYQSKVGAQKDSAAVSKPMSNKETKNQKANKSYNSKTHNASIENTKCVSYKEFVDSPGERITKRRQTICEKGTKSMASCKDETVHVDQNKRRNSIDVMEPTMATNKTHSQPMIHDLINQQTIEFKAVRCKGRGNELQTASSPIDTNVPSSVCKLAVSSSEQCEHQKKKVSIKKRHRKHRDVKAVPGTDNKSDIKTVKPELTWDSVEYTQSSKDAKIDVKTFTPIRYSSKKLKAEDATNPTSPIEGKHCKSAEYFNEMYRVEELTKKEIIKSVNKQKSASDTEISLAEQSDHPKHSPIKHRRSTVATSVDISNVSLEVNTKYSELTNNRNIIKLAVMSNTSRDVDNVSLNNLKSPITVTTESDKEASLSACGCDSVVPHMQKEKLVKSPIKNQLNDNENLNISVQFMEELTDKLQKNNGVWCNSNKEFISKNQEIVNSQPPKLQKDTIKEDNSPTVIDTSNSMEITLNENVLGKNSQKEEPDKVQPIKMKTDLSLSQLDSVGLDRIDRNSCSSYDNKFSVSSQKTTITSNKSSHKRIRKRNNKESNAGPGRIAASEIKTHTKSHNSPTRSMHSLAPSQPTTEQLRNEMLPEDETLDPLKDIEKFIEAGVNLLKRDYKMDDDSIDNELTQTALSKNCVNDEFAERVRNLETPADSPEPQPLAADSLPPTPPPVLLTPIPKGISESGVRRSHRIKQKPQAPKALVGRGVVRDGECTVSYSIDQQLIELAQIELINEKFLKSERLNTFHMIRENIHKCNRMVSKETVDMQCECFLTSEEEANGQWGCGEGCINRMLMIECGSQCSNRERCTNTRFQKQLCSPCRVFRTEKKGCGIVAEVQILPGDFVMEYVGEVIDNEEFERRQYLYSKDKNRHYYFMALRPDAIIDATVKGNISRFINHSCDPNAETQKWTVNGELRIGFFSRKTIMPGEEITFDYQYQRYGRDAQPCFCEAENCRGWIGEKPSSEYDDDSFASDGEQLESSGGEEDSLGDLESSGDDEMSGQGRKMKEIRASKSRKHSTIGDDDVSKTKINKIPNKARAKKLKESHHKTPQQHKHDKERVREKGDNKSYKWNRLLAKGAQANNRSENKQRGICFLEDPDVEQEVNILSRSGLKNQSNTLRLSRLMVRAKLVPTRLRLLDILQHGELPCRRLFLDYHGLRLLHGWMNENGSELELRCALLEALESLPIHNKTVLTDSKIFQTLKSWSGTVKDKSEVPAINPDAITDPSCKDETATKEVQGTELVDIETINIQKRVETLIAKWDGLPEIFRIPKRERIEQMKEHEREANRQSDNVGGNFTNNLTATPLETLDRYKRDRFGRMTSSRYVKPSVVANNVGSVNLVTGNSNVKEPRHSTSGAFGASSSGGYKSDSRRRTEGSVTTYQFDGRNKYLPKELHREMFERKVARFEAEKRMAEERRIFEIKCHYFGLDPLTYDPQYMPASENIETGEFFNTDGHLVPPPPRCGEMQPAPPIQSSDPAHYELPETTKNLPSSWIFAITPDGYIYYMDLKKRTAQWEPPSAEQIKSAQSTDSESSDTGTGSQSDESGGGSDACLVNIDGEYASSLRPELLHEYIREKIKERRRKRYERLVSIREISPRREEDRIYNQLEARKYKENKEKIRRRKDVFRRRRSELGVLPQQLATTSAITTKINNMPSEITSYTSLPIQDYLYSSDESSEIDECNHSPLIDVIVQGDKMVDELDALNSRRHLKRQLPLPPLSLEPSTSKAATTKLRTLPLPTVGFESKVEPTSTTTPSIESIKIVNTALQDRSSAVDHKRRRLERSEKRRSYNSSSTKEKFRSDVARIIVEYLKPYRKESCQRGRITNDCDFYHLAKRLTHYIMTKELKYCESIGQTLVVNDSVKHKTRDYIKLYMQKYGRIYKRPDNAPEFKEIRIPSNT